MNDDLFPRLQRRNRRPSSVQRSVDTVVSDQRADANSDGQGMWA